MCSFRLVLGWVEVPGCLREEGAEFDGKERDFLGM